MYLYKQSILCDRVYEYFTNFKEIWSFKPVASGYAHKCLEGEFILIQHWDYLGGEIW